MTREVLDLVSLQEMIREGVESAVPGKVWVKAEIASWSPRANGHCYLSLCQSQGCKRIAETKAMIWKWHFPVLTSYFEKAAGEPLRDGLSVLVRVQVNYSELYGISLFIDDIDPSFTLGEKALERKRCIEKLTAGGYMDMQKELSLPRLPGRLAVISSATAAGYGDFCRHLRENPWGFGFRVDLFEALMQGESAPASIIEAIDKAADGDYDALLILRGGGSEMDLSCFDDYDLAVSIATCPLPVVTAIGHDRDVHIADMVACISVKTPTALADLFLDIYKDEDAALDALGARLSRAISARMAGESGRVEAAVLKVQAAVQGRLQRESSRLDTLHSGIRLALSGKLSVIESALQSARWRLSKALTQKSTALQKEADSLSHRIRFAATSRIGQEISAVALKEALIKASDPRNILSLGYVLVTGKDNKVLKTVGRVGVGDRIGVRFSDGSLLAKVDEVFTETPAKEKTA